MKWRWSVDLKKKKDWKGEPSNLEWSRLVRSLGSLHAELFNFATVTAECRCQLLHYLITRIAIKALIWRDYHVLISLSKRPERKAPCRFSQFGVLEKHFIVLWWASCWFPRQGVECGAVQGWKWSLTISVVEKILSFLDSIVILASNRTELRKEKKHSFRVYCCSAFDSGLNCGGFKRDFLS